MKRTARLFSVPLLILMLLALLAGCGITVFKPATTDKKETVTTDLSIEDIDWTVDTGIVDGERYVLLSYTNNSRFTISGFEISFIEKSDITEEQRTQFFEDIKKLSGFDETDPDDVSFLEELKSRDISISAESEWVCRPGESIPNEECRYYTGYQPVQNAEHFNLTEPDIAVIKYIDDNQIYTLNYDFKSGKYTKETKTEVAYYWTEKEIGNTIPKPKADIVAYNIDRDDCFSFDIRGWTIEDFNAYVKECREKGFTVDPSEYDGFYAADSESGFHIHLSYDEDDGEVYASVETISADE